MDGDWPQVCKETKPFAKRKKTTLWTECDVDGVPLGATNGTEQHGVRALARVQILFAKRDTVGIDRGAADGHLLGFECVSVKTGNGVQDVQRSGGDFRANPVTGHDHE